MHSTSTSYKAALICARAIPTYVQERDRHVIRLGYLGEYCDHRHAVDELTKLVGRWETSTVTLNGQSVEGKSIRSISREIDRMRDLAGASRISFDIDGQVIYFLKPQNEPEVTDIVGTTHSVSVIEMKMYKYM